MPDRKKRPLRYPDPILDPAELLTKYVVSDRLTRHLRVNFITSLDGAATHEGLSGPMNNEADKQVFDMLRMLSDVVLVGAGTLRTETYGALRLPDDAVAWRLAQGLSPHPVLAIVSSSLALNPVSEPFLDAPVRPLVLTCARSQEGSVQELAEAAELLVCGSGEVDMSQILAELSRRGLKQILCEGGPQLFGALIAADAVDELCLTVAPVLEGGDAMRISTGGRQVTREMSLVHALPAGDLLMLRYLRQSGRLTAR